MTIVQDTFYIPDDIATGLATGLYRRIGSVVRYATGPNKGRIVKHLEPISLNVNEQAQGIGIRALRFAQQHKKGVAVTTIGAVIVGTGIWGFYTWKNHEPKVLADFRTALKTYIDSIREGTMDINKINTLMETLEALKEYKNYEKITIQLTAEEFEILVERIYQYTIKLAADNSVEIRQDTSQKNGDAISNLQEYLKVQKQIFENAA